MMMNPVSLYSNRTFNMKISFSFIAKRHIEYAYKSNTVATGVIAPKNQAFQLSTSLLLLIIHLYLTSRC
jgi:hypothetical protein